MPKWLPIALLIAGLIPAAAAQTRGGFGGFHNGGGFRIGAGFAGGHGRGFGSNVVWFGDPFLYSDYAKPVVYESPASPVIVLQPSATATAPSEPKAEPLMIEWQGDKYVRFGGQPESANRRPLPDYSETGPTASQNMHEASVSSAELPPVVLVYPDGHREQVTDYVIANGNLYARGDLWRDGYWNKRVQLSSLDIPATLRANSASGSKFVLPSAPNEVVTRP